ncbi:MAG: hypothetical protein JSR33_00385 [Proteobacteria bacterium]|nr:hypothetical protein [Pseudomonadota bacterium]
MKKVTYLGIGLLAFAINTYATSYELVLNIYNDNPANAMKYAPPGTWNCVAHVDPPTIGPNSYYTLRVSSGSSPNTTNCDVGENSYINFTYYYLNNTGIFCTIQATANYSSSGNYWYTPPSVYMGGGVKCGIPTTSPNPDGSYDIHINM